MKTINRFSLIRYFCLTKQMYCFLFLIFGSINLWGQVDTLDKCYSDEIYTQLISNPDNMQALVEYEQGYQDAVEQGLPLGDNHCTIPVAVHIVHLESEPEGVGSNVPTARVYHAIDMLNDAFQNNLFSGISADLEIDFRLASIDMGNGSAEPAIHRIPSDEFSDFVFATHENFDNLNVPDHVDNMKYQTADINTFPRDKILNIWVVNSICTACIDNTVPQCNIGGFATFPTSHGNWNDGVVIMKRNFGTNFRLGAILTHEVGHYLGLRHTFAGLEDNPSNPCQNNNCLTDGDFVCDTPPDVSTSINCNAATNSCSTDVNPTDLNNPFLEDQVDLVENYMDYSRCIEMFTEGQGVRMLQTLLGARSTLPASTDDNTLNEGFDICLDEDFMYNGTTTYTTTIEGNTITLTDFEPADFYIIYFGDGTSEVISYAVASSTGISHTYERSREYIISVTLVNESSDPICTKTNWTEITVCDANSNYYAGFDYEVDQNDVMTVNFTYTASSGIFVEEYLWGWDDGTGSATQNQTISHTFQEEGTYEVCLITNYINDSECESTYCLEITVPLTQNSPTSCRLIEQPDFRFSNGNNTTGYTSAFCDNKIVRWDPSHGSPAFNYSSFPNAANGVGSANLLLAGTNQGNGIRTETPTLSEDKEYLCTFYKKHKTASDSQCEPGARVRILLDNDTDGDGTVDAFSPPNSPQTICTQPFAQIEPYAGTFTVFEDESFMDNDVYIRYVVPFTVPAGENYSDVIIFPFEKEDGPFAPAFVNIAKVELVEDLFTAGEDMFLECPEEVTIGDYQYCEVTDLLFTWENITTGEVLVQNSPTPLHTFTPTTSGTYRLSRTFSSELDLENENYEVQLFNSPVLEDELEIIIQAPPVLDPTFSYTVDCSNYSSYTVQFTNFNTSTNVNYLWDFGDGQTSTIQNPSHIYEAIPEVLATLSITDNCGNSLNSTQTITFNCPDFLCDCPTIDDNIGSPGVETSVSDLGISSLSGCLSIAGTFIVDQNLFVNEADFQMQPASEIVVNNGATLTILNSVFSGCDNTQMWKGITVEPKATLRFLKNQISDAQYAIRGKSRSTLEIYSNVFDRNFVGVFADVAPGNKSLLLITPLIGNTFSCSSNLGNPFYGQSPTPGNRSFAGVHSQNAVMKIGIPNSNDPDYQNTFVGLRNGITAVRSVMDIYNCNISNMSGSNSGSPNSFSWNISGIGIYSLFCKPNRSIGNTMSNVYLGINNYRSWLIATDNTIQASKVGIRTKYWWQGAVTIDANKITTQAHGIILDSGIQLSGTTVNNNKVTCTGQYGTAIFVINSSVLNEGGGKIESDENTLISLASHNNNGIYLLNSPGWKIAGYSINVSGIGANGNGVRLDHSNNCRVRRISINGSDINTDYTGIYVNNSESAILCCNILDDLRNAIRVENTCENSLIANNIFNNHFEALKYEETGITGDQVYTGNKWNFENVGFDAHHIGGTAISDLSLFDVDPSQSPFDAEPPLGAWFTVDQGPAPTCQSSPDCGEPEWLLPDNTELDQKITDNSFILSPSYGNVLQWQGNQYLYQKLSQNQNLLNADPEMQSFKSGIDGTEIEHLLSASEAYDNSWQYSSNESTEIDGFVTEIESITQQLDSLNLLLLATEDEGEINNLLVEKRVLLDLLTDKFQAYETTDNLFLLNVLSDLEDQVIDNAALSTSSEMGLNEKEVNSLSMKFWINNNDLTFEEKEVLYNIALTCPLEGGESVFRARALYQTFQDDLIDWDQLVDCSRNRIEERGDINANLPQNIQIYPNPTKDELFIDTRHLKVEFIEVFIYDLSGNLVYKSILNRPIHKISSLNISDGLYIVNLSDGTTILDRQKIVIMK